MKDKVADKKSIAKACRDFSRVINSRKSESPDLATATTTLMQLAGGEESFYSMVWDEFNRVKIGDGENYRPKIIKDYIDMIMRLIKSENEQRNHSSDLSDASEEELREMLLGVATEAMKSDPEFLDQVLKNVETEVIDVDQPETD